MSIGVLVLNYLKYNFYLVEVNLNLDYLKFYIVSFNIIIFLKGGL